MQFKTVTSFKNMLYIAFVIVGLAFIWSPTARALDINKGSDYQLGIEVDENSSHDINLKVNPLLQGGFSKNYHRINVSTGYLMGYNLTAKASPMSDSAGRLLPSFAGNDKRLLQGSWGVAIDGDNPSLEWHGFSDGEVLLAQRKNDSTIEDSYFVYYGAKSDYLTPAGDYQARVTYTVTPEIPDNPSIVKTSFDKFAMGNDDQKIDMEGFNLGLISQIGVDFNENSRIDDGESCQNINILDNNHLTCLVPDQISDQFRVGGKFRLLMVSGSNTRPIGHTINYFYQPQIDDITPKSLRINRSVSVNKIASYNTGTLALTDSGDLYRWGKFGDSEFITPKNINWPALVDGEELGGEYIEDIAAKNGSYYLVTRNGSLMVSGDNSRGQLAISTDNYNSGQFTWSLFFGDSGKKLNSISAGDGFAVAIGEDIFTWGADNYGQLGDNHDNAPSWKPRNITNKLCHNCSYLPEESPARVSAGNNHVLMVTNKGRVFSWGYHGAPDGRFGDGRLGFNTNNDAAHMHNITSNGYLHNDSSEGEYFKDIAAGDDFSLVLSESGRVYSFGSNRYGQLGNNDQVGQKAFNITSQFDLEKTEKIVGIRAYQHTALAWTSLGRVYIWGERFANLIPNDSKKPVPVEPFSGTSKRRIITIDLSNNLRLVDSQGQIWSTIIDSNNFLLEKTPLGRNLLTPAQKIIITGKNIDKLTKLWVDLNKNGKFDKGEEITDYHILIDGKLEAWIPPLGINEQLIKVYGETQYGGITSELIVVNYDD